MRKAKSFIAILAILSMVLSFAVPMNMPVLAAGTVTVTYDTGTTYYQGDVVLLTANISGISNIANVAFYDDTTLLGTLTSSPYTFHYINLPLGSRSITAKVTDSGSNVTTSSAVIVSVLAPQPSKTTIAGTDFATYTGGFTTINGVSVSSSGKVTPSPATNAPGHSGNNCVQVAAPSIAAGGDAYRMYFNNITTPFNTVNNKVELNLDMCFADFNVSRYFFKLWGGKDAAGNNGSVNVSNHPIIFKTDGTISYVNANGTSSILKTNGNTGGTNYTLSSNTWYSFKLITWIDSSARYWDFYINGTKALDTVTMKSSAPPPGDGTGTMYYIRNGYAFSSSDSSTTLATTTYYDNAYAYQYQAAPTVTSTITTTNNQTVTAGTAVALTSTASASDSSAISKVQYYQNGQPIGEATTAPYTVNATLPAGAYSIIARAVSANNYSGYSTPLTLTVTAPTPTPTPTPTTVPVNASIMSTKNGAGAIVSMTYDDGLIATAEYNDQMFAKYNLKGTALLIANNVSSTLSRWTAVGAGGRVDFGSHSMTHAILNDEAAPDSTYVYELDQAKTLLETDFPNQDIITFAPSNNVMTVNGLVHVKNDYYAQRKGNRGYNTLSPTANEWYDIKMQGIGDVATVAARNAWIDNAVTNGKWLLEMWHGIAEGGYQPQTKADAESHYAYMSKLQDQGQIWNASFTEATKYIRERQVSTVSANLINGTSVAVDLTYPGTSLPTTVFDYPLTVKVQVPQGWGMVNVSQNGQQSVAATFNDNGTNSAYVSLVPNAGTATLTNGGTSNKLTEIRLNGLSLTGFAQNQYAYTVAITSADLPISITAKPQDSNATVTISPSATVTTAPSTVTISVKDTNNVTQNYTLNFSYTASTNNNLSSISVNGTAISNFAATTTSYVVMAPYGPSSFTVSATTEDAHATVSYTPSATVTTLPATVTVKVTAEAGGIQNYTVNLKSRDVDNEFLNDDFSSYTIGQNLPTTKWSSFNNLSNSGTMAAYDPTDSSNAVGKCYNTSGGAQNQQLNKYIDRTTEPVIVKGRYLLSSTAVGSSMDILVRGDGTNILNICNFTSAKDIKLGSSSTVDAKYVAGSWVNYVLVIKPSTGKYSVTGYFFGPGVRDTSGNPATVVATRDTASNSLMNIATMNCRILVRGNVANGTGNELYLDDIRLYSPGVFKITAPTSVAQASSKDIAVQASHDIAFKTFTTGNIVVKDSQNNTVSVSSVDASGSSFTLHFANTLPTGSYTITLADAATDVAGQKAVNTGSFTVQ